MGVFDKLMAIKQIRFKDGKIKLMNQRVMIIPSEILISMTNTILKNKPLIGEVYTDIKTEFNQGWSKSLRNNYDLDARKFMEWLINLTNLSGWGLNKLTKFNPETKSGVFTIEDSPIGMHFKGKTKEPVDHYIRALYAGGASTVFGENIDWIEVECIAQGYSKCKLVFGPREKILKKYPKFAYQISKK